MSCIAAPKISIGDIPGLSLLLGDISIDLPDFNSKLCCEIDIPIPPIPIPIGAILKGLLTDPTGAGATTVETVMTTIKTIQDTLNALLDQLSFDCPLD